MGHDTITDAEVRAARDAWEAARPRGEREGAEYAAYVDLVRRQSAQVAAAFRARARTRQEPAPHTD